MSGEPRSALPFRLALVGLLALAVWGAARLWPQPPPPEDPGITLLNPRIRVELTRFADRERVPLQMRGAWELHDAEAADGAPPLAAGSDYVGVLALDPTGVALPPHLPQRDSLVLRTRGDDALRIGSHFYPGTLHVEVLRAGEGSHGRPEGMRLSLDLDLEEYVLGVVCGEMATGDPGVEAALRAQAVAARTYALWRRGQGRRLRDSVADQAFLGTDYVTEAAREAVDATRGLVLTWEGALLPAYYHARCGGGTADAAALDFVRAPMPPLAGVADAACVDAYGGWTRAVPAAVLDRFAAERALGDWTRSLHALERDAHGRVLRMRAVGSQRHADLGGESYRIGFGLPSALWTDARVLPDGSLEVSGRGWGHGVGLCQRGARRRARAGADHEEILAHYYPGAQVVHLALE